ncbi:MAG: hypothetical protein ACYCVN_12395 [Acidimicrobiales bacterium]
MQGLAFWFAVGIVAIASVILFKIVGLQVPYTPVQKLAAAA